MRCRDPRLAPSASAPGTCANPARTAVHTGFEIQIDELAGDDGMDRHRTGAFYDIADAAGPASPTYSQTYSRGSALQPGAWNNLEITVAGDTYTVRLNDHTTSVYTNPDRRRGGSADQDPASGFIGLQQHTGAVSFRAVRIREGTVPERG